jgi:hypothetical protein
MGVAAANRHDMKLVTETLAHMMCARPMDGREMKMCLDLGYDYDEVRHIVSLAGFDPVIVSRRDERENKKQRGARAKRCVVERTHSELGCVFRIPTAFSSRHLLLRDPGCMMLGRAAVA